MCTRFPWSSFDFLFSTGGVFWLLVWNRTKRKILLSVAIEEWSKIYTLSLVIVWVLTGSLPLNIIMLRCIHVIACINSSLFFFLLLNSSPLCGHKHFFVHSWVNGYLNYFQLVAFTDKSAINIGVQLQVFVWIYSSISLGWILRSGRSNSMICVYLVFKKLTNWFLKWLHYLMFLLAVYQSSRFSTFLPPFGMAN